MVSDDIRETEDGKPVIALTEDVIIEMIDKLKSDLAVQQQNATLAAANVQRIHGAMATWQAHLDTIANRQNGAKQKHILG